MKKIIITAAFLFCFCQAFFSQENKKGIRGEPEAITDAIAMVNTMGGMEIWAQLKYVHFVHVWHYWNRIDSYVENEILDLTGPRSWVEMKSEIYHRLRAYSPEHRYWNVVNGQFAYANDTAFQASMERAPFHLVRIARAIATGDSNYGVRYVKGEFANSRKLEFYGSDNVPRGWILLNARKEPWVWSTTQYTYTFGPMKSFGNLKYPDWGSTGNGAVIYEMVSLTGSNQPADLALFIPPEKFRK